MKRRIIILSIAVILGALAGYGYYHFWGCTDNCPIRSNWFAMTSYGALFGLILGFPGGKKKKRK